MAERRARARQGRDGSSLSVGSRRAAAGALAALVALALAGCNDGDTGDAARQQPSPPPAELRAGDVVVRAGAVATAGLPAAIARRYGVDQDRGTVLLTVSVVRAAADGGEAAIPARVRATRIDLLGRRTPVALRVVGDGARAERAGDTRAEVPDTLRFEVEVLRDGAAPATLRFHRDFF